MQTTHAGDALGALLKWLRVDRADFVDTRLEGPWTLHAGDGRGPAASAREDPRPVFFQFVQEGGCTVEMPDGLRYHAPAGDLLLLTGDGPCVTCGAGRFVRGYAAFCGSIRRAMFDGLPPVVRVRLDDGPTSRLVHELLRVGLHEASSSSPGGESFVAKAAEMLLMEVLRRYAEDTTAVARGWLAGMRDPRVGQALRLMLAQPGRDWTVHSIARAAALSRSALSARFTELVGEPPMQYLQRWRLTIAASRLGSSSEPIAYIAETIGYKSEASFNRAFSRHFGKPPASWRRAAPKLIGS
jgi:AraC-like DNA-binding protein